jgi:hypothetical protein
MSNPAEDLFLQHGREKRAAHDEAKWLADRMVLALHDVRNPVTFGTIDLVDLRDLLHRIEEWQTAFLDAERAERQSAREAFGR